MKRKNDVTENKYYHDTWQLLKKYRDVVWSLELSVKQVKKTFEIEYGTSIEDFLDSIYMAGADLSGTQIEQHARSIERSRKMLNLLNTAVELMRTKHKSGEQYYWILYYSFLSPQELSNIDEIIDHIRPYVHDISHRTFFRRRRDAISVLSSVLWGYTSKECIEILDITNFSK